MPDDDVVAVRTDAGMLSVWCPRPFASVGGYDAWEQHVNDRLQEAIANGELVPVNIGSDGAWGVRVAVAPDGLTERERTYAVVTSEPYLLVVSGGEACLSGIEAVGDPASAAIRIPLADGRYTVRSTIVAWNEGPGALAADGARLRPLSLTSSSRSHLSCAMRSIGRKKLRSTPLRDRFCRCRA
jgi:hypothetical protein